MISFWVSARTYIDSYIIIVRCFGGFPSAYIFIYPDSTHRVVRYTINIPEQIDGNAYKCALSKLLYDMTGMTFVYPYAGGAEPAPILSTLAMVLSSLDHSCDIDQFGTLIVKVDA